MLEKMKAVVIKAPMDFGVEEVPVPKPEPGDLLVKVKACGLCGSDLRTLRSGHRKVKFPWVVGHEICSEVVEAGEHYKGNLKKGDLLSVGPLAYCGHCNYCVAGEYDLCENQLEIGQKWWGGFAEYMVLPEAALKLGNIRKVPADANPVHIAVVEPVSSCVNAQEKAAVGLGETVVIIGSGPIGCIHINLARLRGASRIYIIDISEDRLGFAEPFGPDALINAAVTDPVMKVRELTGGIGADVIIAATPAPVAAVQAVEMAKKGGRIIQFGGMPKDNSKPQIDMNIVHYNGLHIIGTTTFAPKHNLTAMELVITGKIHVDKLVTHTFPLSDFKKGAELALEGKVLKGVFLP